jgi:SAM-dependent methyltransferase
MKLPSRSTLAKVYRTVRVLGGVDSTLAALAAYVMSVPAKRGHAFDEQFGIDTTEPVGVEAGDYVDDSHRAAIWYYPSTPQVFRSVMRSLGIEPRDYVFIDIGCGKGRVLVMAGQHPWKRVIGVEGSAPVASVARKNLESDAVRTALRAPVEVVTSNALSLELPPDDLLIYLYNPFSRPDVYTQFLAHLEDSLRAHPRKVILVYAGPEHRAAFDRCHYLKLLRSYELLVEDYSWCAYTNVSYVDAAAPR